MDKTIVLDCQAKVACYNCEDCIVFRECALSKKSDRRLADTKDADMEIFVDVKAASKPRMTA